MKNILTVYNRTVTLETDDRNVQMALEEFLAKFYTINRGGFSGNKDKEQVKVFVGKIVNRPIWTMHEVQFVHFYKWTKERGIPFSITEKIVNKSYEAATAEFEVREGWTPREAQIPVIDFITKDKEGAKLVPLTMGSGKGPISLFAMEKIRTRVGIVILPFLMEKWVKEICQVHNCKPMDVMVVQGSKALRGVIAMAKEGTLEQNYVVISHNTMQDYITAFEADPELTIEMYGCAPHDLFPTLGIGMLLVDETHMAFHSLYKIVIYTNTKLHIGMSGTLKSDDNVVSRMHSIMFSEENVYGDTMTSRHIDVYPISYNINEKTVPHIKTTNYGSNAYSHTAFEKSMLRKAFNKEKYFKLIYSIIEDYYLEDYKQEDKLVIFVSTVEAATDLSYYIQELLPMKIVNRYCEEDSMSNLLESDIIVSTIQSAGTGVDIPKLRVVINTVSISSTPTNLQVAGRLRKQPDRDVKYCYIYSNQIRKQITYHEKRMEIFKIISERIVLRRASVGI